MRVIIIIEMQGYSWMCLLVQCFIEGAEVEYFHWTFNISDPMNCETVNSNVTMTTSQGNGSESTIPPESDLKPTTPSLSWVWILVIAGMNGVVN